MREPLAMHLIGYSFLSFHTGEVRPAVVGPSYEKPPLLCGPIIVARNTKGMTMNDAPRSGSQTNACIPRLPTSDHMPYYQEYAHKDNVTYRQTSI